MITPDPKSVLLALPNKSVRILADRSWPIKVNVETLDNSILFNESFKVGWCISISLTPPMLASSSPFHTTRVSYSRLFPHLPVPQLSLPSFRPPSLSLKRLYIFSTERTRHLSTLLHFQFMYFMLPDLVSFAKWNNREKFGSSAETQGFHTAVSLGTRTLRQ